MDHLAGVTELVELRSYRLAPGAAGAFVAHFEAHFLAAQERLGMDIVGQFTVPGDDARFLWVRRFRHPSTRAESLARFYGGPVWEEFGPRANELMVDHTDVHLLVPDRSLSGFATDHVPHEERSDGCGVPPGDDDRPCDGDSAVVAAVFDVARPRELDAALVGSLSDAASTSGVTELGRLVTASVTNDFPRLPVHEGPPVAVWLLSDRSGGRAATATAGAVANAHGLDLRTTVLTPTGRSTLR